MKKLDGVVNYNVDYLNHSTVVTLDENKIKIEQILQALDDGGYPAFGKPRWLK